MTPFQIVMIYVLLGLVSFGASAWQLHQQFDAFHGPGAGARTARLGLIAGVLWLPYVILMVLWWVAPNFWRTKVVHYVETGDWV